MGKKEKEIKEVKEVSKIDKQIANLEKVIAILKAKK
tara:strand:+ start:164 stop:271 length:108 start_codon:yes stop_codon:yes gene_type:complete